MKAYSRSTLPTALGSFDVAVYRTDEFPAERPTAGSEREAVLISKGDLSAGGPLFVRIHSQCFTGEVLGSELCDCAAQLQSALKRIQEKGRGAVIYLNQEGRGIGLGEKLKAYALQAEGADTAEANRLLGYPEDLREYGSAVEILRSLGVRQVVLHTNNPLKIQALQEGGIDVVGEERALGLVTEHNRRYLRTKWTHMRHKFESLAGSI